MKEFVPKSSQLIHLKKLKIEGAKKLLKDFIAEKDNEIAYSNESGHYICSCILRGC